jgi:D-inositol-3-phosphate glycosyltransferase
MSRTFPVFQLPSDMPAIAFISEHDDPLAEPGGIGKGGQNVYVREVAHRLGSQGWQVDVFTRRESLAAPTIEPFGPAARVIRVNAGPATFVPKEDLPRYMPEFTRNLLDICAARPEPYQLVHGHYYLSGVLAHKLQHELNIPFVQTFHSLGAIKRKALGARDGSPPERLLVERQVAMAADCVVATSPQERDDLIELYGTAPEKIQIVPCGVDLQRFRPVNRARARATWGLPRDSFLVVFVGRVEAQKGIDILLRAAARLRALAPDLDFHVAIVGGSVRERRRDGWGPTDDRYTLELEALARELGVEDRVIWTGALPHAALSSIYSAADVVTIPSRYESFGMTALEAMACGACVVASRTGGLRATLNEGRAGLMFEPGVHDELAAHMARLAADPAERTALQRLARPYVARTYGWSRIAEQLGSIYEDQLGMYRMARLGATLTVGERVSIEYPSV